MEKLERSLKMKKHLFIQDQHMEFQKLQVLILQEIIEKHMVYFVVVVFFLIMSLLEEDLSSLLERLLTL